jgi:alpha-methylacyl-CoA racemase
MRPGPRGTNMLDSGRPQYDVYETADGEHMAVGALEEPFLGRMFAGLGLDPVTVPDPHDRDRWPELRKIIAAAFRTDTLAGWTEVFAGIDACVTPVLGQAAAVAHPQSRARETFVEVDDIVQPAPAPRFSRTPGRVRGLPVTVRAQDCVRDWTRS